MNLKKFDAADYVRYPCVEDLCGEIVPRLVQVKMGTPDYEGLSATLVIDGNGIQVLIYDEAGEQKMVFCRELYPFALALFVAEHLEDPLGPEVLSRFGFARFK